jgi:hypothetical protein
MSTPIYDFLPEWANETDKPKRPLIMFAGEATTPYHPSTIHGAFESGIREAYRLDLALEPTLTGGIKFDESYIYQPTFSVRRRRVDPISSSYNAPDTDATRNGTKSDMSTNEWFFDHDASILRGVETFGFSTQSISTIKSKMLAPYSNTHSVEEMEGRYKLLMQIVGANDASKCMFTAKNGQGQLGTWLAPDVVQGRRPKFSSAEPDNGRCASKVMDDAQTRRSVRTAKKNDDDVFTFY